LANRSSECSLAELCIALGLHKSTVHRLMMVLEQHRLVDRNPETGRYRLGLKLFELDPKPLLRLILDGTRGPILIACNVNWGNRVLCILDDGEVFYLDKVESQQSIRTACTVGSRARRMHSSR